jgi:transposase
MLLVGYHFGITSERPLCDEVKMHLGYRWFVGLALDEKVPDHSTFSKNRHGRFKQSGIYQVMFDEIVQQCIEKGLVSESISRWTAPWLKQTHRLNPRAHHSIAKACGVHR